MFKQFFKFLSFYNVIFLFKGSIEKVRQCYESSEVQDILKDISTGAWTSNNGEKAFKSSQAKFAQTVAEFIQADFYAIKGIAVGMVSPRITIPIFGKALVTAGSTTAKVLSGTFAVYGIAFGIWDVVGGVDYIDGSDHSKAYREAATNILKYIGVYDEFERTMTNKGKNIVENFVLIFIERFY